jgi:hypothetical protein
VEKTVTSHARKDLLDWKTDVYLQTRLHQHCVLEIHFLDAQLAMSLIDKDRGILSALSTGQEAHLSVKDVRL